MKRANGNKRPPPSAAAIIAPLTMRCGHCATRTQHYVRYCGQYRVCAECQTCGWHRRLGDRVPRLQLMRRPA